jgi:hypothetical protein
LWTSVMYPHVIGRLGSAVTMILQRLLGCTESCTQYLDDGVFALDLVVQIFDLMVLLNDLHVSRLCIRLPHLQTGRPLSRCISLWHFSKPNPKNQIQKTKTKMRVQKPKTDCTGVSPLACPKTKKNGLRVQKPKPKPKPKQKPKPKTSRTHTCS